MRQSVLSLDPPLDSTLPKRYFTDNINVYINVEQPEINTSYIPAYCGTPVDLGDLSMHKENFQAIKSLRPTEQILITKPDKGSGVVILSKSDYIQKMGNILDDKTKFMNMGSVDQHDNAAKTEQKLQKLRLS